MSVTEISKQTKGDYESKLEAAIIDLRDQQNADLEALREELEAQYSVKVGFIHRSFVYRFETGTKEYQQFTNILPVSTVEFFLHAL